MIWLYSGTPGSGKSYHAVYDILKKVRRKKKNKVIANFPLVFKKANQKDNFIYIDNSELTIEYLENYAKQNHFIGVEGQTLVVVDEAQLLYNSRDWGTNSKKRMAWIKFFSQHRKYGYNFILIAQFDKMIDKQIRALIEYEVSHMKMNNFFWFLPASFFLAIERWYGQKMKTGHQIIPYRKSIASSYNSYITFDNENLLVKKVDEEKQKKEFSKKEKIVKTNKFKIIEKVSSN